MQSLERGHAGKRANKKNEFSFSEQKRSAIFGSFVWIATGSGSDSGLFGALNQQSPEFRVGRICEANNESRMKRKSSKILTKTNYNKRKQNKKSASVSDNVISESKFGDPKRPLGFGVRAFSKAQSGLRTPIVRSISDVRQPIASSP